MSHSIVIRHAGEHQVLVDVPALSGPIRFWLPECINIAWPGFDPAGACMLHYPEDQRGRDRADVIPTLMRQLGDTRAGLPPVCTRGPETQLKLETADEVTAWKTVDDTRLELDLSKPGVFRYSQNVQAADDSVVVEAKLHNLSSWDWRDAYVYYCCGVDPCPALTDQSGERTALVTGNGLETVSSLRKCVWSEFRPTAQYYEAEGRPMPRTGQAFAFDECGISPHRVVAGLVVRKAEDSDLVLAVASRRFRSVFMDMGEANNCLHANPSAGDLPAGSVAELRGAIYLLHGSVEDVAVEVARREEITLPPDVC